MSSLYSDPPFARGTTLLNGEVIEYSSGSTYTDRKPVAGTEIVGTVKAFLDIHPVTKARLSNELVYCIAARYKPASESTVLNPSNDGSAKGKAVVLRMDDSGSIDNLLSTAEFTSYATAANVLAGYRVAFIDEYLSSEIRANDIVWLTFKGPAIVAKKTGAGINAGALVSLETPSPATGVVVTKSDITLVTTGGSERVALGQCIGTINTTTNVVTLGGDAASGDTVVRANLFGVNWAI